ncbi:hypothetical protein [Gemmatimonas sp.]
MPWTEIQLQGRALRDAVSLAAQVMSDVEGDDEFVLHATQQAGYAEMTDGLAEVVLAVVAAVIAEAGSLEAYWERIAHRGVPLYDCAGAIAGAMLAHGMERMPTLIDAAVTACVALMAPVSLETARE